MTIEIVLYAKKKHLVNSILLKMIAQPFIDAHQNNLPKALFHYDPKYQTIV